MICIPGLKSVNPGLNCPGLTALLRCDIVPVRDAAVLPIEDIEPVFIHFLHLPAVDCDGSDDRDPGVFNDLFQLFRFPVILHDIRTFHDFRVQVLYGIGTAGGIHPVHPVHKAAGNRGNRRQDFSESCCIKQPGDCFFDFHSFLISRYKRLQTPHRQVSFLHQRGGLLLSGLP